MGYLNLFTPTMMLVERNHAVMRSPYHCAVRSFAIRRDFYIAPRPPGDIVVGVGNPTNDCAFPLDRARFIDTCVRTKQSIRNESRRRTRTAEAASSCGRLCVACRSRIGRLTPSHCVQCVVAIHLRGDDCVKFRSPVARFRSQSGRDYRECN